MKPSIAQSKIHQRRLHAVALPLTACSMLALSASLAAAVDVRVQPSGSTPSTAYALVGESRTYFGHAVDGTSGTYNCTWVLDGIAGGSFSPADPNYIETTATFGSSGLHTVQLACQDGGNPAESDSGTIEVRALSTDTALRQKNSAIDRGLRYSYQQQNKADGCFGGSGSPAASTGMALVAMENHGHNLDSNSEDIYRWSLEKGLQCLYDHSATVSLSEQLCIGNPESGDGDGESDGKGIRFGGSTDQYYGPFSILAIVNATDAATGATITPTTSSGSDLINGSNNLVEIIRDARDYLAWSMTDLRDFSGGGSSGLTVSCEVLDGDDNQIGYFAGYQAFSTSHDWTFDGWANLEKFPAPGIPGAQCASDPNLWEVDFGDGNSLNQEGNCFYGYGGAPINTALTSIDLSAAYGGSAGDPSLNVGGQINHTFAAAGTYTVTSKVFPTEVCSIEVTVDQTSATACLGNGWRYQENDTSIDNSNSQWPVLALYEAFARWGIDSKQEVKDQLDGWLDYSQNPAGGELGGGSYGYDAPGSWLNTAKAGAGLIMRHFTGYPISDTKNQLSVSYIGNDWTHSGVNDSYGNKGSLYAMYAVFKGLKLYGQATIPVPAGGASLNWNRDYDEWLVANQESDGGWDTEYWMDKAMTTYFGVAILAPEVSGLPPVAVAGGPYGPVNPLQGFQVNGSNSFHQDPAKQITAYQWDFNATDGLWWDTKPAPAAGEGATGVTAQNPGYADTGVNATYTITLRVQDNSVPQEVDTDTATASVTTGNVPPVARTNGPWAGVPSLNAACSLTDPAAVNNPLCFPVTFDGSASSDPNAGDSIAAYAWDLDGDGTFNETNGDDGWPQGTPGTPSYWRITKKLYAGPTSGTATLRVTDGFGLQNSASDDFVAIAFVFAQQYSYCYSTKLSRTVEQKGVRVTFKNVGGAEADNVRMTLKTAPANVSIVKGVADLGDVAGGANATSDCGGTLGTSEIVWNVNLQAQPTGGWSWEAKFDFNGVSYTIPNLPALAP